MRLIRFVLSLLAMACAPAHALEIDGRIDPQEWREATHVTHFHVVQPLTGLSPQWPVQAWIMATPEGLAVAIRVEQPQATRTRQKVQRDFSEQVDRVNLMVDYDGDGRTAYNFVVSASGGIGDAVISNENQFNSDWDGSWLHATSEDAQGWNAELLIPWHIAPMRSGVQGKRTLKLYLDRVIGATGERAAWPNASYQRSRFVSDFSPLTVPAYQQTLLAMTPYASVLRDQVNRETHPDAGVDIFWKPSGQFQLSATINPDFGQVESDDLVVNFDATETFFSDKRPFFTENQGIFEYTTPSDYSQLLYTRRIGGPADDASGAGDITAALKLNGSLGATKYGLFVADEADVVGRTFAAARVVRDFSEQNVGAMLTHVRRPWLQRDATVAGIDHNWRPTPRWNVRSRVFGSRIDQPGRDGDDLGATLWADYEYTPALRYQFIGVHFGNDLQINDAGYLARNSLNYAHLQVSRRITELSADSRYASQDWRGRLSATDNDHGDALQRQLRVSRDSQLRDGSSEYAQLNVNGAGVDDLLTRGHGVLKRPPNFNAHIEYNRPRKGRWGWSAYADVFSGGLAGNQRIGYEGEISPTLFLSDRLNVGITVSNAYTPDWLVWQRDTLVGRFRERSLRVDADLHWTIDPRQELRIKLQSLGLDAGLRGAVRVQSDGSASKTDEPVDDFSVRTLGFQIRYRFELAPLSYLYVVYGRGGYELQAASDDLGTLWQDSFRLRNDEQLLVKLNYRFEL